MNEVAIRRSLKITAEVGALANLTGLAGPSSSGGAKQALTVWKFKQSEVKALKALAKTWGAKNNTTVNVSVFTPDVTYATKVLPAAKSHTLPDIVSVYSQGQDWTFAEAGIVQDLTRDFTSSWQRQFLPEVASGTAFTAASIKNSWTDPATTLKDLKAGHFYSVQHLAGTPGALSVPAVTVLLPVIHLDQALGLNGTPLAVIFPLVNAATPTATVLITITVLNFVGAWNEYVLPELTNDYPSKFPLPVGLQSLLSSSVVQRNQVMAAALNSVVPTVILFVFLQRYFINGLQGSVKG